jgi:hypothetical protein
VAEVEYVVECDCHWSCRGSEEQVIAATVAHGLEVHGLNLGREQVLAVAQPVESDSGPPGGTRAPSAPTPRPDRTSTR